jgi:hypothetical protein
VRGRWEGLELATKSCCTVIVHASNVCQAANLLCFSRAARLRAHAPGVQAARRPLRPLPHHHWRWRQQGGPGGR